MNRSEPAPRPRWLPGLLLCAALACGWLVACSTPGGAPGGSQSAGRGADGPPDGPLPDLLAIPNAEPRVEPIRPGGANKPYEVQGRAYVPLASDQPVVERGLASWYGRKFHGRRTASGETYNMLAMTAAHRTMPIPSYARVRNPANGQEVIVRVNDRGPFSANRIIDLSYTAAAKLGILGGVKTVEVERITHDEIRAGLAERAVVPETAPVPPAPVVALAAELPPATQVPGPAPDSARAYTPAAVGYWLQLGAFGRGEGAYNFQQRVAQELAWLSPLLTVFADGGLHRLQAGPYGSRDQAREVAERVRVALQLVPVIVERR